MGKKKKLEYQEVPTCQDCENYQDEIELLKAKMDLLERVRSDQVDELLVKQRELYSDVADLLVRNVRGND